MSGALIATASSINVPRLPSTLSATGIASTPSTARGKITLAADGDIDRQQNGTVVDIGDWLNPKVNMGLYEARFTPTTGALTGGTANTWQTLGTDRLYEVTRTGLGTTTCIGTLEIRLGATVYTSSTVTLTATIDV